MSTIKHSTTCLALSARRAALFAAFLAVARSEDLSHDCARDGFQQVGLLIDAQGWNYLRTEPKGFTPVGSKTGDTDNG